MTVKPAYFEPIREQSAKRWDQLDSDPELAGPWHQLFKQVQSPRHILSELLQNADDAHATQAWVEILDGYFSFSHNGEDFTEEHFSSLCRFGYSNKRALHTIGFRGIGFKSTFSLGELVELYTPSLSIGFNQKRFTEPFWMNSSSVDRRDRTTVRVAISDEHREKEARKNLEEWLKSPVSLLFFRNIRRISINGTEVHWSSFGEGPIKGTEWLALDEKPDKKFLLARSAPESFPEDALREVRQERMLGADQDIALPPCQLEIVVGVEGRLFVVLPTGVKTDLPFACNAPFIQDPARLKIKDPEISPTNRWLLERAGKLAAEVMLNWLGNTDFTTEERAVAYDMMPEPHRGNNSLDGVSSDIVKNSFRDTILERRLLLTDNGHLAHKLQAAVLPNQIYGVWPREQATTLFDDQAREPLSQFVTAKNISKLRSWKAVAQIEHGDVLKALQTKPFPKPSAWRQLLDLWSYIDTLIYEYFCSENELRIVPVQGKDILLAASEVVRLDEEKVVSSDEDWAIFGDSFAILDQNWMRYLTEQQRAADSEKNKELQKKIERNRNVLQAIGLNNSSNTGRIINHIAESFFAVQPVRPDEAVRLAHLAAKLGAAIGDHFKFICQDNELRSINYTVIYDEGGKLDLLLPKGWAERHLLHTEYSKQFRTCSRGEWDAWVGSGRAGLKNFVPLERVHSRHLSETSLKGALRERGYQDAYSFQYSNPRFVINDWDFGAECWEHWEKLEIELPTVWSQIVEFVLAAPSQWTKFLSASVSEFSSKNRERSFIREGLVPQWLTKLAEKQCLPDVNGVLRKPSDLLMRTPDTEAMMDVEPFVHALLDSEANKPLLRLLGVSDKPIDPEKILRRLKGLALAQTPPEYEVDKWYRRLDQLMSNCSTDDSQMIKEAFETDQLIFSESGTWENAYGAFLSGGEEDVPDIPLVRAAVKDLTLWRKIGVGEQPTAELALEWLRTLPSERHLEPNDMRRVKTLVSRYPKRVWDECGHWLNLAGEWVPTDGLGYSLSMQALTRWNHLHQWVKQKTADLQMLSVELNEAEPFNSLPPLSGHIDEIFEQHSKPSGQRERRAWLEELGQQLSRIKLEDEQEAIRIRELATELAHTQWLTSSQIEIIPYIDGKPAGTPRKADALWHKDTLYVEDKQLGKLAKAVAQELGRAFRKQEIGDAIKLCFDREPFFVRSYIEENFELIKVDEYEEQMIKKKTDLLEEELDDDLEDFSSLNQAGDKKKGEYSLDDGAVATEAFETSYHVAFDEEQHAANEVSPDADLDEEITYRPVKKQQTKAQLIERFALANGFKKHEDNHFFAGDGCLIVKAQGALFPWELRNHDGEVIKHYIPMEHCLERDHLQLGADIWGVLEREPDNYALILIDPDGKPVEVSGKILNGLRVAGVLTLHPSTYRLVIEHNI